MVSASKAIPLFIGIWLLCGYLPCPAQETPVTVKRDTVIRAGESFAVIERIVDNSQSVYKITKQALDSLNSHNLPLSIYSKLTEIKGRVIKGRKSFTATLKKVLCDSLKKVLCDSLVFEYQPIIQRYADRTKYEINNESLEHLTKLGKIDRQTVEKLKGMEKKSFTGEYAFKQSLRKVFDPYLTPEDETKVFTFTRKVQKINRKTAKVLIMPAAMTEGTPAGPGDVLRLGDQLLMDNSVFIDFRVVNYVPRTRESENVDKDPALQLNTQEEKTEKESQKDPFQNLKAEAKSKVYGSQVRSGPHTEISPEIREYYAGFFQAERWSEGYFRQSPGAAEFLAAESLPEPSPPVLTIIAASDNSGRIGFGIENGTVVVEKVDKTIPVRIGENEIQVGNEAMFEVGGKESILFLPQADTAIVDGRLVTRKSDKKKKTDYGNYFDLSTTEVKRLPLDSLKADTLATTFKYVKKDVWSVFKPWYLTPAGLLLLGGGAAALTTTAVIITTNGKEEQRQRLPEPPTFP